MSEHWGQREGIILAGIAIKGTFNVILQSDSVQMGFQGSAEISSSVTASSHAFLWQDFPGVGRAVPTDPSQGAQHSWEE